MSFITYRSHRNFQDFSNPEVAKHLQFYRKRPISEVWQAQRWKEYKPSELYNTHVCAWAATILYRRGAALEDASYVIPLAWIKREGVLCANCLDVIPAAVSILIFGRMANTNISQTGWKIGMDIRSVPALQFRHNYHDVLERIGDKIRWAGSLAEFSFCDPGIC